MDSKYSLSIDRFQYFQYNCLPNIWLVRKVVKLCSCSGAQENAPFILLGVLLGMLERLWVIMESTYGLSIDRFQCF